MEKIKLKVTKREQKTPNQIRREGYIPGTLYGADVPSECVQVCAKEFSRLPAGVSSHVIELDYDGTPTNAVIRNVQRKSTKDFVYNIEFYKVNLERKVAITLPIKHVGVSPAVLAGGKLEENFKTIRIEALPNSVPNWIEVDLGLLDGNKNSVHFADLKLPEGVSCLNPADEIIIKVKAAKVAAVTTPEKSGKK